MEMDMRPKPARYRSGTAFALRRLSFSAACAVASATLVAGAGASGQPARSDGRPVVVLDNARVRVLRATGAVLAGVPHRPGVAVPLEDGPTRKKGEAYWSADNESSPTDTAALVFVEPKAFTTGAPPSRIGSKPGDAPFVGMSFKVLFENETATAIRARMEVNASEGVHTHASDTIVVHLSGGAIEDTANGKTRVNRWKPGDVELESRGSSHSARNVGKAIDVVLVALKK